MAARFELSTVHRESTSPVYRNFTLLETGSIFNRTKRTLLGFNGLLLNPNYWALFLGGVFFFFL